MNEVDKNSIENRLNDLEEKLDYIIKILGITSFKTSSTPPPIPKPDLPLEPKKIISEKVDRPIPTESSPLNLLAALAIICFFLAAIFIVNLAIESGWLTPERQWGILTLFGIALFSFSITFEKIEANYRSYAGAAGIVVLYIASYSSFLYFGLFSPIFSMALGGAVSLLCFYLLHYFKSELFVVLCVVGTYISPILLNKNADLIYLSSFFLIWAAIFSTVAMYFKTRVLNLLASYLGLGIFAFLNLSQTSPDLLINVIIVQSMQFIIYAGGVYFYSIKHDTYLSQAEAMAYLPILLFFYGTIYYFLNIYNSDTAPFISLAFASFVYFLYWRASKHRATIESETLVKSFFSVVLFHSGYMQILPMESKCWLLPLILLALYISELKDKESKLALPFRVLFSTIAIIEFLRLCDRLITTTDLKNVVPAFITIVIGIFYYIKGAKAVKNREGLFLSLIHVISILALYRLAYDYGSFAVTLVWGIYSSLVLVYGYTSRQAILAKSSLLVLMIATMKALFYDASQASSITRIGSLILTGLVLYGAGYLFQKINSWS